MNKFKNPIFWIGVLSAIYLATGLELSDLSSWSIALDGLISIIQDPSKLIVAFMAVYAMFNNNDSKKLDNPFKK